MSMAENERLSLVLMITAVVVAVAVLWGAMESHYRSCVTAAQARFPAVPVSALSTRGTGPLKLSFVREREQAVERCGRLPI
jgi:hypothetical protein